MNPRQLLRMAKWAKRPPSWRRVVLVISVIVICFVVAGMEWLGLLPEWATMEPSRGRSFRP